MPCIKQRLFLGEAGRKEETRSFIEQSSPYCDTDMDGAGVRLSNSEHFPLFSSTVCVTDQQMERA